MLLRVFLLLVDGKREQRVGLRPFQFAEVVSFRNPNKRLSEGDRRVALAGKSLLRVVILACGRKHQIDRAPILGGGVPQLVASYIGEPEQAKTA